MNLFAHIFRPKNRELLSVHEIGTEEKSKFVCRYSAPVGLMGLSPTTLKNQCREHIERMIESPSYGIQTTSGHPTDLSYLILTIIRDYYAVTDVRTHDITSRNIR